MTQTALRSAFLALCFLSAGLSTAHAVTNYTVTSLAFNATGTCDGTTCTTLRAALEAANALPAGGDGVLIQFDESIQASTTAPTSGIITADNGGRMRTQSVGADNPDGNVGPTGASFVINSAQPVTIDFDNRVYLHRFGDSNPGEEPAPPEEIDCEDPANEENPQCEGGGLLGLSAPASKQGGAVISKDHGSSGSAMFFIQSDNVVIENFDFGYGMRNPTSNIVIDRDVSNVTIRNGRFLRGYSVERYCLYLFDGASNVTIENIRCNRATVAGVRVDNGATVNNLQISGSLFDGGSFRAIESGFGTLEQPTTVNGLTVSNVEFASGGHSIFFDGNAAVNDVSVTNSIFFPESQRGIQVMDADGQPVVVNNLSITDNRFSGTQRVVGFADLSGVSGSASDHSGITFSNNVVDGAFCAGEGCGLVHLRGASFTNTLIADNVFRNLVEGTGAAISIGAAGADNAVRNNLFNGGSANDASSKNVGAINNLAANPGADTGWVIHDNEIVNLLGSDGRGPIFNDGDGYTLTLMNTFGVGTNGAAAGDGSPESGVNWFVVNNHAGANDRIQTWRPVRAWIAPVEDTPAGRIENLLGGLLGFLFPGDEEEQEFDNAVWLDVIPVEPPLGSNNPAGNPVVLDVYYSTTDVAETYLGRMPAEYNSADGKVTGFVPANIDMDAGGIVRVQTIDAQGRSSQYSAAVELTPAPPPLEVNTSGSGALGPWLLLPLLALRLRRRAKPVMLGFLGLMFGANAMAYEGPAWLERFYVGAQIGALSTDFDDEALRRDLAGSGFTAFKIDDDQESMGYGLWLGYAVVPNVGLELAYTTGADEDVRFTAEEDQANLEQALAIASDHLAGFGDSLLVRARYHHAFNDRWFVSPHVGLGVTRSKQQISQFDRESLSTRSASSTETTFTWALGAGLHYRISRNWSAGIAADYYQGSSDNAYTLLSGLVEWRFPRALEYRPATRTPMEQPVQVVEPMAMAAAPAQPAAPAEPQLALDDLSLDGVTFALNGAELTAQSRSIIDALLPDLQRLLAQMPMLDVQVAGHTDSTGSAAINQRLSQERAEAVKRYLVDMGISAQRLSARGYGSSEPITANASSEGRAANRRVELRESQT